MSDQNAEPTMEEILASIRRIISEDEPAPEASTAAESATPPHGDEHDIGEDDDDILELTDRVENPEEASYAPSPSETSGDLDIYERPAPRRADPPITADIESDFGDLPEEEALVSAPIAASASSAFDQLARTIAMPGEGRTLEDVVRELLRPMLAEWLEKNLPATVDRLVAAEISRIVGKRV